MKKSRTIGPILAAFLSVALIPMAITSPSVAQEAEEDPETYSLSGVLKKTKKLDNKFFTVEEFQYITACVEECLTFYNIESGELEPASSHEKASRVGSDGSFVIEGLAPDQTYFIEIGFTVKAGSNYVNHKSLRKKGNKAKWVVETDGTRRDYFTFTEDADFGTMKLVGPAEPKPALMPAVAPVFRISENAMGNRVFIGYHFRNVKKFTTIKAKLLGCNDEVISRFTIKNKEGRVVRSTAKPRNKVPRKPLLILRFQQEDRRDRVLNYRLDLDDRATQKC